VRASPWGETGRAAGAGRDGAGAGDQGEGGRDALRPRPAAAQGDPERPGRRLAGALRVGETSSGSDPFDGLAHEFAERYRRGERPSVDEYAAWYPHLAAAIRELFPTLAMMERIDDKADRPRGPAAARPPCDGPMPERLGD